MRFRRRERNAASSRQRRQLPEVRRVPGTGPAIVDGSNMLGLMRDAVDAGATHASSSDPSSAGPPPLSMEALAALLKAGHDPRELQEILMGDSVLRGLRRPDSPGRAEHLFQVAQIEPHHLTSIAMTSAASLALRPGEAQPWLHRASSPHHDPRPLYALEKAGITIGVAIPAPGRAEVHSTGQPGWVELSGLQVVSHNFPYDALLLRLPRAGGATCYLVPLRTPDGAANRLAVKDVFDRPGTAARVFLRASLQRALAFQVGPDRAGDQLFRPVARRLRADAAIIGVGQMSVATEVLASGIDRRRDADMWHRRFAEEISLSVAKDMAFDASELSGSGGELHLGLVQHWIRTRFGRVVPDAAASLQLADLAVSPAVAWTSALLPLWGGDARTSEQAVAAAIEEGELGRFLARMHFDSGSRALDDAWRWLIGLAREESAPMADRVAATALVWAGSLLAQRGRRDALAVLLADDSRSAHEGRREGAVVIDLRTEQSGPMRSDSAGTH